MNENRMKKVRNYLELSQSELAAKLNVPKARINDIERNRQKMAKDIAESLEKLGFNYDWLIKGIGEMLIEGENPKQKVVPRGAERPAFNHKYPVQEKLEELEKIFQKHMISANQYEEYKAKVIDKYLNE